MKTVKTILCCLALITYQQLAAKQTLSDDDGTPRLSVYGGAAGGLLLHPSFGEFVDSYNSYYGSSGLNILDGKLKNFKTQYGYRFGATYYLPMGVGLGMSYEQQYSHQSVGLTNGNKRHFTHISRNSCFNFSFLKNHVRFDFRIGIAFPVVESAYEYADGTISTGRDKNFNGIYAGVSFFTGADLALTFNVTSRISIDLGVTISGMGLGEYSDENWVKGEARIGATGPTYLYVIPTDVASASTVSYMEYDSDKSVKAAAFTPGIFLNMQYALFQ